MTRAPDTKTVVAERQLDDDQSGNYYTADAAHQGINLSRSAEALAGAGWPVLPLRGKVPVTKHGALDATTDVEQVRQWWQRFPTANIGARIPETLLVIDVDPRNGGDAGMAEVCRRCGSLPATLTTWSGRGDGGAHLYFLRPAGALSTRNVPAGIDVKVRGYMVMPPSVHPDTGRAYTWEKHPVAALPPRWRKLLYPAPAPRRPDLSRLPRRDGQHLVDFVASQGEGNRNSALFWAACAAAQEGQLALIHHNLLDAAVRAGLSEAEAAATIASARRKVTQS